MLLWTNLLLLRGDYIGLELVLQRILDKLTSGWNLIVHFWSMPDCVPILQLKRVFPVSLQHIIGILNVFFNVCGNITLLWVLLVQRLDLLYFSY